MLQPGPFLLHLWQCLLARPSTPPYSLELRSECTIGSSRIAFTGDVYEEQEGDLSLRAQFNEMCRFQGRLREENSIVRNNTHRVPMDVGKTLLIVKDVKE